MQMALFILLIVVVILVKLMITDRTWTYEQATGMWLSPSGDLVAQGYAGYAAGKNSPPWQDMTGIGPLPRGLYTAGEPHDDPKVGKYAMRLTPSSTNEMYGRSDFFIHGDSASDPGNASEGCIVLPLSARQKFWASGDHTIQVTHG